ncbi:MAG: hypothetical protein AAB305_05275 [Candidatus Zixiibacteriota bacterium]
MRRYRSSLVALFLAVEICLLMSCRAIKIETGATAEEQTASNSERASSYKREWASTFNSLGPKEQIAFFKRHVDSTVSRYVAYGKSVAKQWHEGSAGRGAVISDDEMRKVVEQWISTQKPFLDANDDILEYGLSRLKERRDINGEVLSAITQLSAGYYDCQSAIFFPSGTIDDYENRMLDSQSELQRTSADLERMLQAR